VNEVFITEMKNNREQQYLCITVTHYTVKMNVLYLIKKIVATDYKQFY